MNHVCRTPKDELKSIIDLFARYMDSEMISKVRKSAHTRLNNSWLFGTSVVTRFPSSFCL